MPKRWQEIAVECEECGEQFTEDGNGKDKCKKGGAVEEKYHTWNWVSELVPALSLYTRAAYLAVAMDTYYVGCVCTTVQIRGGVHVCVQCEEVTC